MLKEESTNSIIFDTLLQTKYIVNDEIAERFTRVQQVVRPTYNLTGTGFNEFYQPNYYRLIKGELYGRGVINENDSIIRLATTYYASLDYAGYSYMYMTKSEICDYALPKALHIQIPADNIPKMYLVLLSLSGKSHVKDYNYDPEEEIADFMKTEYAFDFGRATKNEGKNTSVPIVSIGDHKFHFIRVLLMIQVHSNNEYSYYPIGYVFSRKAEEYFQYDSSQLLRFGLSNRGIGDYIINTSAAKSSFRGH